MLTIDHPNNVPQQNLHTLKQHRHGIPLRRQTCHHYSMPNQPFEG
jgi:hypothetical protein